MTVRQVATNAFGMGIDKSDVRMVIHIDCPRLTGSLFQEAGRGGREGEKAYAVLLYNQSDENKLMKRIDETFRTKNSSKTFTSILLTFSRWQLEAEWDRLSCSR